MEQGIEIIAKQRMKEKEKEEPKELDVQFDATAMELGLAEIFKEMNE